MMNYITINSLHLSSAKSQRTNFNVQSLNINLYIAKNEINYNKTLHMQSNPQKGNHQRNNP